MGDSVSILLGLGSNLDDREANLRRGVALLARSLEMVEGSSVYETEPWGHKDQPRFLNLVCWAHTGISPAELLRLCQETERAVGRTRTFRYGPRLLDVDILAYGDSVITTPTLVVPHPRLAERRFVLVPMAEVAPEWVHPVTGRTASELLDEVEDSGEVRAWGPPVAVV
jgi:2-amino-4-hydroxy-6-hydroxymethyldihydropteridine diphosphokinase